MTKKRDKTRQTKAQRVRLRGDAAEDAALRLEALARGLRSGVIHLADGDAAIEVPAGSDLSWEVKARAGRRKSRVKIDIRWRKPEDDGAESSDDPPATGFNPLSGNPQPSAGTPLTQDLENPAW